ncbi:MAG TPA: serine hydrolase domain-containing protein [Candidatus Baltobacteraceae bacterium]|nr:serine hydrolase domain-containing protein [Candidatus Baltobacteraceae bacterium]
MDFERQFDRIAQRALQSAAAPSLSIAATYDGRVAYCKAFGDAAPHTVYGIASITKQFTAACILLLVRAGKLSLDDPVAKWFPRVTAADRIRVHHLLTHTSGLPDYYPLGFADEEKLHAIAPEAVVEKYGTQRLQFEPGSAWSYSNTGFHLLGLIVERVTGDRFGDFLTQAVLVPSGMTHSFFNDPPRDARAVVQGYTRYCLGPLREAPSERAGWTYASGGIASSAEDLARWHVGLMNAELLRAGELAIMTQHAALPAGPSLPALGWFCEQRGKFRVIQHSGGVAGFASQVIVAPGSRCSVVVLANGDHVQTGAIASELFEHLLPGAKPPPPNAPTHPHDAENAARNWIDMLVSGTAPPDRLTPEFHAFLSDIRRGDASAGVRAAGDLLDVAAVAAGERGGMDWFRVRCEFAQLRADAVFRQTGDGRLAEFMLYPIP